MRTRRWSQKQLEWAVQTSTSIRQVLGKLGLAQAGGNYDQVQRYLKKWGISTAHFTGKGWNVGLQFRPNPPKPLREILIRDSSYQSYKLKKRLFNESIKEPKCELCGWCEKTPDGRLPLELDHINGDRSDNRLENIRILCPNCHSLQPTHRGLNRRKKT